MTKSAKFIVQVSCRWTQTTATHTEATAAQGGCASLTPGRINNASNLIDLII